MFLLIHSQRKLAGWLLAWWLLALAISPAWAVNPEDLLPAEQAFAAEAVRQGDSLQLTLTTAPGYYLYRDRSKISSQPQPFLGTPQFPAGVEKNDRYFGLQVIYTGKKVVTIPLQAGTPAKFDLIVRLQGCSDSGVCYPPYTHTLKIGEPAKPRNKLDQWLSGSTPGKSSASNEVFTSQSWWGVLASFLLAGIGMAFTACMYPLLPIVSAFIAGQGSHLSRGRGFLLTFIYVQGLALSYTLVGVIAGLTGSLLTVWLQQPAVILSASGLMVLLALSMFDLYALQLPAAWQTRLAQTSGRLSGGKIASVFGMGALSALLIGPCVAPPLALALAYIGSQANPVLGGLALYMMALGLGLPLILIGTFGGHVLPRAGRWMQTIKSTFGVVILGLALWLASPFLPVSLVMLLWAALCLGCAVFLPTFRRPRTTGQRLGQALGIMLLLIGAAQLAGVLAGASSPRYPLQWLNSNQAKQTKPMFLPINNNAQLDQLLQQAKTQNQPLLLDFYADWCISCKEMEAETFTHPTVQQLMQGFILVQADVTANLPEHQALLKRFGLYGPPGIILFTPDGQEAQRVIGFSAADEFGQVLRKVRP